MFSFFNKYKPTYYQALKDLLINTVCYTTSFYGVWYSKDNSLSLLTVPLLGLMTVRTFIIFHDCGHNSYTPNQTLNYIIGSILGIFVFTPFCWNYDHHNHHLTSGNKDNKLNHLQNETVLNTLTEYNEMRNMKYIYRVIKNPLIFFTVVPSFKFFIINRGQELLYKYNRHPYKQSLNLILFDTVLNNLGIFLLLIHMDSGIIYHYLIAKSFAFSLGFLLFHNQHTFNPLYVVTDEKWNKKDSGLLGSSFIQIPKYLKFFTVGIEYHHLHHISYSIPGYNLHKLHEEMLKNTDDLDNITKLSMRDCYHNLWLSLYDEENDKYISFEEIDKKIK